MKHDRRNTDAIHCAVGFTACTRWRWCVCRNSRSNSRPSPLLRVLRELQRQQQEEVFLFVFFARATQTTTQRARNRAQARRFRQKKTPEVPFAIRRQPRLQPLPCRQYTALPMSMSPRHQQVLPSFFTYVLHLQSNERARCPSNFRRVPLGQRLSRTQVSITSNTQRSLPFPSPVVLPAILPPERKCNTFWVSPFPRRRLWVKTLQPYAGLPQVKRMHTTVDAAIAENARTEKA